MTEHSQAFCNRCGRHTLHVRGSAPINHVVYAILSVITAGVFLIVWLIDALIARKPPFRCTICGQIEGRTVDPDRDAREARTKLVAVVAWRVVAFSIIGVLAAYCVWRYWL